MQAMVPFGDTVTAMLAVSGCVNLLKLHKGTRASGGGTTASGIMPKPWLKVGVASYLHL